IYLYGYICTYPSNRTLRTRNERYEDPHYPLVIISLNGFAKTLLERDLHSLRKIEICGVTSEVIQWLDMPSSTRPGLILVSNDDIIRTLRIDTSDKTVAGALDKLDHTLDSFFSRLQSSDILGCVNIAIVSDQVLAHIATIQVPWNVLFLKGVLDHLNTYTLALSKELGRVICITGTAYDRDFDGIADANKTSASGELLLQYTARLRDVELISGIEFELPM
ncbi:hypothetical protein TELCIR_14334, partial [Teladorsagia circumcincta]